MSSNAAPVGNPFSTHRSSICLRVRATIGPSGKPRAISFPPLTGRRGAFHTEIDAASTPFTELWSKAADLRPYSVLTPTVPAGPLVDVGNAAASAYAARAMAGHPEWWQLDRMPGALQLSIQWMATHGGARFDPSQFAHPIGSRAAGEDVRRVGPTPRRACR